MQLKLFLPLILSLFSVSLMAQSIDQKIEFKTGRSAGNFSEKKMSKAPKKLFVNQFLVHYQVLFFDSESTRSGVNYGATSASLSVGFDGIEETDLQKITDQLYREYVNMMKSKGYDILPTEDFKSNKAMAKSELFTYETPSYEQLSGYISCMPSGFKYFLQKGKPVLSGRIRHDGLTADVVIEIPFIVDAESGASKLATSAVGGVSKIVVKPSLRINDNSLYAYNWSGGSYVKLPMKEPLVIDGVFKDQKFKASAGAQTNTSTTIGATKITRSWDVDESRVQNASCDPEKYKKGVFDGAKMYLTEATSVFMEWAD
jgi:hypothetical protein